MPYKIRKNTNKNTYKVYNSVTGKIHAAAATLNNAKAQLRILNSLKK